MSLIGRFGGARRVDPSEVAPELQENTIKDILDRWDSQPEVKRLGEGHSPSYSDYLNVSSLVGICTRQHVLAALDDRLHFGTVTGGHRVMWAFGRAVENHIRSTYLEATARRGAFGNWSCRCGNHRHQGFFPTTDCETCGGSAHNYSELVLLDHRRKLKGSPDIVATVGGGWFLPVEIKSMNADEWKGLKRPKGDHIMQVGVYHRMLAEQGWKVLPQTSIIYTSKDFRFGSPYKEFHVDTRDKAVTDMIDTALSLAEEVANHKQAGTLPPREKCGSPTCTTAKGCPMIVSCWNRD